jgi:hypothetical protein
MMAMLAGKQAAQSSNFIRHWESAPADNWTPEEKNIWEVGKRIRQFQADKIRNAELAGSHSQALMPTDPAAGSATPPATMSVMFINW